MVSYHIIEQRHAIWMINDASEAPQRIPLYEQTKYNYHNNNKTQINSTMNHVVNYGPMRGTNNI